MGSVLRIAPLAAVLFLACNGITGISDFEKVPSLKSGDASTAGAAPMQVVVGRKTSCAIGADKSVWCWGTNPGVAPGAVSSTPVKVTKLKDTAAISIGLEHVCALFPSRSSSLQRAQRCSSTVCCLRRACKRNSAWLSF